MFNCWIQLIVSRLQMLLSILFFANCLASAIYGFLLSKTGYITFYSVVICLQLAAITFTIIFVVDKKRKPRKCEKKSLCQNMKIVFQARPNRAVLWLLMICSALVESYSSGMDLYSCWDFNEFLFQIGMVIHIFFLF